MVNLHVYKVKTGLSTLEEVPDRYRTQVLAELVKEGLYDEEGNKIVQPIE